MPSKKTATTAPKVKAPRKPKIKAPAIPAKVYEQSPKTCNHQTAYGDAWCFMSDRKFQQCSQCGDIRFTPGYEPPAPTNVYQPPVIAGEAISLFDMTTVDKGKATSLFQK